MHQLSTWILSKSDLIGYRVMMKTPTFQMHNQLKE
jgi:hypothetical protein